MRPPSYRQPPSPLRSGRPVRIGLRKRCFLPELPVSEEASAWRSEEAVKVGQSARTGSSFQRGHPGRLQLPGAHRGHVCADGYRKRPDIAMVQLCFLAAPFRKPRAGSTREPSRHSVGQPVFRSIPTGHAPGVHPLHAAVRTTPPELSWSRSTFDGTPCTGICRGDSASFPRNVHEFLE